MELSSWEDQTTLGYHIHIFLTQNDILKVYPELITRFRLEFDEWGRKDASIEEQLMLLQLFARVLEEKLEKVKTNGR